jgi:hypothetical protein
LLLILDIFGLGFGLFNLMSHIIIIEAVKAYLPEQQVYK